MHDKSRFKLRFTFCNLGSTEYILVIGNITTFI
jgi:hypothetical protein